MAPRLVSTSKVYPRIAAYTMTSSPNGKLRAQLEQHRPAFPAPAPAPANTPGRFGRLLCRVGLHKWQTRSGVEAWSTPSVHRTYNRCGRAGCARESWQLVDERTLRVPNHRTNGG